MISEALKYNSTLTDLNLCCDETVKGKDEDKDNPNE